MPKSPIATVVLAISLSSFCDKEYGQKRQNPEEELIDPNITLSIRRVSDQKCTQIGTAGVCIASQFAGADWIEKVNAASASLGAATHGEIWIDQAAVNSATARATLSLANVFHSLRFVQGGTYPFSSSMCFDHRSKLICSAGVTLQYTSTSGNAIVWGQGAETNWEHGGMEGCKLLGPGSGTPVGIALGDGVGIDSGQGMEFSQNDIAGFYHGVVWNSPDVFLVTFHQSSIHDNLCNGVLMNMTGTEMISFDNCNIFRNGMSSATCTGIQVAANKTVSLFFKGGSIDSNGNGTLGQIYSPSTSVLDLHMTQTHFEQAGGVDSSHIQCLGATGGKECRIYLDQVNMAMNAQTATVKPAITMAAGFLTSSGLDLYYNNIGGSLTRMIDVVNTAGGFTKVVMRGSNFTCGGGAAVNAQLIGHSQSGGLNYDITGSRVTGCTRSPLYDFVTGNQAGCHDLDRSSTGQLGGTYNCSERTY